ncbi:hypothetical protein ACEPAF_271 [Sanghuangporus sanghuang]
MTDPANSVAELVDGVQAIFNTKLVALSSLTILLYDYSITFGREKDLVWNAAFGWGKLLFLLTRYLTLGFMIFIVTILFTPNVSDEVRNSWVRMNWFAGATIVLLSEVTLQLRLYAMYGKTRKILFVLLTTSAITIVLLLTFIIRLIKTQSTVYIQFASVNSLFICRSLNVPSYYRTVWVPLFVHEVFLFLLAVLKGMQSVRSHGKEGMMSRFVMILVKDSILYYIAVFSAFFSLELVWAIYGTKYLALPVGLVTVIASVMCQRLLLNIREQYMEHTSGSSGARRMEMPDGDSEDIMMSELRAMTASF